MIDGDVAAMAGETERTHGERLPNEMTTWLAAQGRTLADVDYFAVVSGPGSFTGLRVGVASIQGLALAARKRVIAVPTLDAMAKGWLDAPRAAAEVTVPCLDGASGRSVLRGVRIVAGVSVRPVTRGDRGESGATGGGRRARSPRWRAAAR